MKAVVYEQYGPPEVLKIKEIEKPVPKDDEVLLRVHAVSINDWDWQLLLGIPFVNRMINGLFKPKKQILGSDVAGRIEAVGKNVKKFKIDDEVYGDLSNTWGGFAEYVCAKENTVALKPAEMTFEQAAAIPQAAMLAVQSLIDTGKLRDGLKILINGAGGGVGTYGIQIAKQFDVEVTGVDSAEKLDMMMSLGYDHVIDYKKEDFTKSDRKYDLIVDTKTNRCVFEYLRVLNPDGVYATVGGNTSGILRVVIWGPVIKLFTKKKVQLVILQLNKDLPYMNELFFAGKVKSVIDGPYKLKEVPEAMRYFGEGKHKGKVVISIIDN
ncbi:MAG: NAD(P)-dependent alcohol dehydrogenase [Calditrichaceae bacterium]